MDKYLIKYNKPDTGVSIIDFAQMLFWRIVKALINTLHCTKITLFIEDFFTAPINELVSISYGP